MQRFVTSLLVFASGLLCLPLSSAQSSAVCNFDPDSQLVVEYQPFTAEANKPVFGHEIPFNKVWAPGGKPMTMFVNHPVTLAGRDIPVGAYTLFLVPSEKQWTLIVSRSTDTSGKYDEHDDLVRVPMESGELSSPERSFSVYFAHLAPTQCNMRVDLDKVRAWVDFNEKK
jgi:GNAT superfamily N-acetyltransferase